MKTKPGAAMWIALTVLALALVGSPVWAGDTMVLSDDQLGQVYGGESSEEEEASTAVLHSINMSSLSIESSAQRNNASMITITAVSSVVGAQVNVIANMGSIGSASQQATLGGVADNP
jgi:hypothetical protein